jgi:hypothetical protein
MRLPPVGGLQASGIRFRVFSSYPDCNNKSNRAEHYRPAIR